MNSKSTITAGIPAATPTHRNQTAAAAVTPGAVSASTATAPASDPTSTLPGPGIVSGHALALLSTPAGAAIVIGHEFFPVRPSEAHGYVIETRLVARGYGVKESALREHKRVHADELVEGKHFISVRNPDANPRGGLARKITYWTKRGVIRLGFFIRSRRAKLFRDAAEDLVIDATGARRGFLPRSLPEACRALAAAIDRGLTAEDALKTISPEVPFGTLSRKTGQPRELLVPAYFRSRTDPNGRTLKFLTLQLDFLGQLEVPLGAA